MWEPETRLALVGTSVVRVLLGTLEADVSREHWRADSRKHSLGNVSGVSVSILRQYGRLQVTAPVPG